MSKPYLKLVDTSTQGRYDVTPLFTDPTALKTLAKDLCNMIGTCSPTVVCAIDALGFILGTAIACEMDLGVVPIRKGGKLPCPVHRISCIDYSGTQKALELRKGILKPSDRVVVVDEWVETGAQVLAAMSLVRMDGATVVGAAALNFDSSEGVEKIRAQVPCFSVWAEEPR
jgi:adenine phosphoribosyltransferase